MPPFCTVVEASMGKSLSGVPTLFKSSENTLATCVLPRDNPHKGYIEVMTSSSIWGRWCAEF